MIGIDPDRTAISEARRIARASGARNVRFSVAPAQALGIREGSVDTALFSWSL